MVARLRLHRALATTKARPEVGLHLAQPESLVERDVPARLSEEKLVTVTPKLNRRTGHSLPYPESGLSSTPLVIGSFDKGPDLGFSGHSILLDA